MHGIPEDISTRIRAERLGRGVDAWIGNVGDAEGSGIRYQVGERGEGVEFDDVEPGQRRDQLVDGLVPDPLNATANAVSAAGSPEVNPEGIAPMSGILGMRIVRAPSP
jgi:hypothetical protein